MTPAQLACLHGAAFTLDRPWSEREIADLLTSPHVAVLCRTQGFAMTRTVLDESELLTLAVHPDQHRTGVADGLMTDWVRTTPATRAFLEVAADNTAALALYRKHGFAENGRRRAYYRRDGVASVDAVLMQMTLPPRQPPESPVNP
ncbi:GNAT family N-acetyltransferase [Roseobacter sp.]|uniref:GNAT family N-acetyltransferase n=1 Tax=Roseobacter sp. TaxID=1907202 RepID=UPI0032980B7C